MCAKGKEMPIAGHDQVRFGLDGGRDDHVVLRVERYDAERR
jgi:hypothetical protein